MDFELAEKEFQKYLENYDANDGSIALKIRHTYEVVRKSEYIAQGLKLDDENIKLAKIIALLHDIGRFEQVKETEDFKNIFPSKYNTQTINYEAVSPKVFNDFIKHKCIKLEDRKTIIDYWVCVIAFIFDLNFDISLKYVKENNYIDILINRIDYKNADTKKKMEDIRECAKKYIENRCNKNRGESK